MSKSVVIKKAVIFNNTCPCKCDFQVWDKATEKMVGCGKPTIGKFKKTYLCEECFYYSISMEGVPISTVTQIPYLSPGRKK